MFSRTLYSCLAVLAVSWVMTSEAAPLVPRKVASLECNLNRAEISGNLLKTLVHVDGLTNSFPANSTEAKAVQSASDGVGQVQSAIQDVALNVSPFVIGLGAPPQDRQKVTDGLNQAMSALTSIQTSNSTVSAQLNSAMSALNATAADSAKVVANCN